MTEIFSKLNSTKLLHKIYRREDIVGRRDNIINDDQLLQCAAMKLGNGQTFRPHRHIWKHKDHAIVAQESWVVIRGRVKVIFYDIDNTVIHTDVLNAGDASFTLDSGHNYEVLEDDTLIYEFKTGPYEGQESDKVFI